MNLSKLENPRMNKKNCRARQEGTIRAPFFQKKLSDIFEKIKGKYQNRPENQELGPILGQNGDPDLIKLFPALLGQKKTIKNNLVDGFISIFKSSRKPTKNIE